ncbi:MAG: hypothetical protein J6C38_06555 [Oscillospiraceae bacterium]|nr:hypothetical protein [Oscillospiraceae bacterium]
MSNNNKIMNQYDNEKNAYQAFASEIKHLLGILISSEGISCNAITYRLKDRSSLIEKIDRKKHKYSNLNDITDIAGVRVITYYAEDADKVAEIVEHEFLVDKNNSIDKGKALEPDRFGYCSIHYVVEMNEERLKLKEYQQFSGLKCEIQIRSVLQHAWAEIEHDLGYKNSIIVPQSIRRNFSRLAGLLEIADKEFQDIRQSLSTYEFEIAKKIARKENIEIDTFLLCELAKHDPNIIAINQEIGKHTRRQFDTTIEPCDCVDSVSELSWFNINTLDQLNSFIKKNGDYAIKIAEIFCSEDVYEKEYEDLFPMKKDIAFFYLCYAELVSNEKLYDIKTCIKYLRDNNIGSPDDSYGCESSVEIAKELMDLRQKFRCSTKR